MSCASRLRCTCCREDVGTPPAQTARSGGAGAQCTRVFSLEDLFPVALQSGFTNNYSQQQLMSSSNFPSLPTLGIFYPLKNFLAILMVV